MTDQKKYGVTFESRPLARHFAGVPGANNRVTGKWREGTPPSTQWIEGNYPAAIRHDDGWELLEPIRQMAIKQRRGAPKLGPAEIDAFVETVGSVLSTRPAQHRGPDAWESLLQLPEVTRDLRLVLRNNVELRIALLEAEQRNVRVAVALRSFRENGVGVDVAVVDRDARTGELTTRPWVASTKFQDRRGVGLDVELIKEALDAMSVNDGGAFAAAIPMRTSLALRRVLSADGVMVRMGEPVELDMVDNAVRGVGEAMVIESKELAALARTNPAVRCLLQAVVLEEPMVELAGLDRSVIERIGFQYDALRYSPQGNGSDVASRQSIGL